MLRMLDTPDEWGILEIRGMEHTPEYDPDVIGAGMSVQTYRREVLGDWSATTGKVVYPEFGAIHKALDPLPFDPGRPLVCGWDFGGSPTSGTPAFVPTQLNARRQWLVYPPLVPGEQETVGIYEFTQWVAQYLAEEFAAPAGLALPELKLVHIGDPAGDYHPPRTQGMTSSRLEMRSCYQIIERGLQVVVGHTEFGQPIVEEKPGFGWRVKRGEVTLAKRMEALRSRLTMLVDGGLPALVVDPAAKMIIDGFEGGYHYPQRQDGRYELDPAKNHFSHPMNALEYAASRLGTAFAPEPDDEGPARGREFTTRTPGRRRPD